MAGMFGAGSNTKAMMQDLEDVASMYSQAKPASDDGIMKAPQGDQIDAGSWWAWLSGATRQKAKENVERVQEELSKMNVDTSGTSPQYQQELLDGILQARQYRKDWGITESLSDKPKWLEQQGDFPMPEQSEVTTEELPPMDEEASLFDRLSNIQYVAYRGDTDPDTGQKIKSTADIPAQTQGLMSRNVYSLEGPESVQDFSDTKVAQIALAGLGYDIGRGGKKNLKNLKIVDKAQTKPSEVRGADGIMGNNTKAAIKAFQEDNGLEVTGNLDAATVKALETTPEPTFKYDAGYFSTDKQNDNMTAMYKAAVDAGIEGLELVALMSQAAHESDKFKTAEEYASGNAYEGRTDLGNTQAGDGKRYKGRGYLQITGRTNYKKIGDKLGVDLVSNPEKLEDKDLAARASVEWWKQNVQPLVADFSDVERVTKIVNGGFNGLADRQKYFKEFLDR